MNKETYQMNTASPYIEIAENIDRAAIRAPKTKAGDAISEAFIEYLKILFTPEEAEIARHLKVAEDLASVTFRADLLMTPIQIARVSGKPLKDVNKALESMGKKSFVLDIRKALMASPLNWPVKLAGAVLKIYQAEGLKAAFNLAKSYFVNVLANAREFGLLSGYQFLSLKLFAFPQIPYVINIQAIKPGADPDFMHGAELYQHFFVEENYSRFYQSSVKGTSLMRTISIEKELAPQEKILDSEEAHKIIDAASYLALMPCPCRSRTEKMGVRQCTDKMPVGYCINMGLLGMASVGLGLAKQVTHQEAKDYLDEQHAKGCVASAHNNDDVSSAIICLCCGCCCSQTRGRIFWGNPDAMAPSNFFPMLDEKLCDYCGKCAERCMFKAVTVDKEGRKRFLDPELCIGCGVCIEECEPKALKLHRRERAAWPDKPSDLYNQVSRENFEE
jgi:Pyruvate/2-oxoacid:ferredoxin oxidoreductase delta subunit